MSAWAVGVLLLAPPAQHQERELEAVPGEQRKEQMGLALHRGPRAPSLLRCPRAALCWVPCVGAIRAGYSCPAPPPGWGVRPPQEPGLQVPALRGSSPWFPWQPPQELTCSAVNSAGADGAARSKNILFPCKCHQS